MGGIYMTGETDFEYRILFDPHRIHSSGDSELSFLCEEDDSAPIESVPPGNFFDADHVTEPPTELSLLIHQMVRDLSRNLPVIDANQEASAS